MKELELKEGRRNDSDETNEILLASIFLCLACTATAVFAA